MWLLDIFEANRIVVKTSRSCAGRIVNGDITLRSYLELDILVHKADEPLANVVLMRERYRAKVLLNPRPEVLIT